MGGPSFFRRERRLWPAWAEPEGSLAQWVGEGCPVLAQVWAWADLNAAEWNGAQRLGRHMGKV